MSKYSYTYNRNAGPKPELRYYTRDELELMTTYQLRDICYRERIINGIHAPLDKDVLIREIMRFRGRADRLFITEPSEDGLERLESLLATAKLDLAAKRLVFGKLLNCGQTCVAPDYLLIDGRVKDQFLSHVKKWMTAMYEQDPLDNQGYVRMINRKHYDRVMGLIDPAKVVYGGRGDPDALKIQPTILDGVSPEDPVMQEEIFGPLLPVLTYDTLDRAVEFINSRPHPLALYLFSEDRAAQERFLRQVPFGGGCVNDTIIHLATSRMGFGGVGDSGMGSYHGKLSFDTFSHQKSVVKKSTWMDLPVRYAPYTALQEKLLRLFLR